MPSSKLVLGVPFYGHGWGNVAPAEHGLHQAGKAPSETLSLTFRSIKSSLENKGGYIRHWDDYSKAPFLYNAEKRIFISYEDEQSLTEKCIYINKKGLAGAMFWEYTADYEGQLLNTLHQGLNGKPTEK